MVHLHSTPTLSAVVQEEEVRQVALVPVLPPRLEVLLVVPSLRRRQEVEVPHPVGAQVKLVAQVKQVAQVRLVVLIQ